ncbi:hypothetical protein CBL_10384 [Carabus blaptoides fortunei]
MALMNLHPLKTGGNKTYSFICRHTSKLIALVTSPQPAPVEVEHDAMGDDVQCLWHGCTGFILEDLLRNRPAVNVTSSLMVDKSATEDPPPDIVDDEIISKNNYNSLAL